MFNKTKRLLALILVTVIVVGVSPNVQSVYADTTNKVTINNKQYKRSLTGILNIR